MFGLQLNLGLGAAKDKFNVCVTQGTDATWYGADGATYGSLTPDSTITDQTFYSLKWKADGTFIMAFGDAGDEQVPDVVDIKLYTKLQTAPVIVAWDETSGYYTGIDATLATTLISAYVLGQKVCFDAEITPYLFIQYDYNLETVV